MTRVIDALAAAREIAGRIPEFVCGAAQWINRISNAGANEHFDAERKIILKLNGSPIQVEAVTAIVENHATKIQDVRLLY